MRKLTQQEIDQAPEWATHYDICDDGDILFENEDFFTYIGKKCKYEQLFGVEPESKPIPRKEFDIWQVKFNGDISLESCDDLSVTFIELENMMCLGRTEIIAAAKHFKLTASDLS